jgi:hypothetical protein
MRRRDNAMFEDLTAGRLLARNTVWNLVGEGAPPLVGVIAIPVPVRLLGTARPFWWLE